MRQNVKGFSLYILPLILYCVAIFVLSSNPLPEMPDFGFDFQDKVQHAVAFMLMTLLAYRGTTWLLRHGKMRQGGMMMIAVCFAALYGGTDEIHQMFVPGRTADIIDWIADLTGALLAIPVITVVSRTRLYPLFAYPPSSAKLFLFASLLFASFA